MSEVILLAWSSPASEDVDGDFNAWYDQTHIPEVTKLLGVTAVERFTGTAPDGAARYLTLYRVGDGLDAETAAARLGEAAQSGGLTMTPTMDLAVNLPDTQWVERKL